MVFIKIIIFKQETLFFLITLVEEFNKEELTLLAYFISSVIHSVCYSFDCKK